MYPYADRPAHLDRPPLPADITRHDEIVAILNEHAEAADPRVFADAIEDQFILIPRAGVPEVDVTPEYLPVICINAASSWHQAMGRTQRGCIEHEFGGVNLNLARAMFLMEHREIEVALVAQYGPPTGNHAHGRA